MAPNLLDSSHRRLNLLTGEWVVVSPNRTERPWQGQVEDVPPENKVDYDPTCYLCPGNARAGGKRNGQYTSTYVFDNDFPGLQQEITDQTDDAKSSELLIARPERGICRVGCFSPRHNVTLADLPIAEIKMVVAMWADQFQDLGGRDFIQYVQIFENRGAMMGASNPHPHCQIWGTESLPNEPAKEQASLQRYMAEKRKCLLCDYLEVEVSQGERLVFQNDDFAVVVPFWAMWPFETLVVARNHIPDISGLSENGKNGLAVVLQKIVRGYNSLFNAPFPYSMGFHQQPCTGENHPEWHFHAHFYPPLLRSASIKKFMVGFELLGSPQRDILPESAAERLRVACKS